MSSKFTQIVTSFVSALFVLCSIFWCTQISQAQDNITALVGAPANHYCYSTVHTPINILWTPGTIIKPDSTTPMTWQLCFNSGRLVDEDTTTLRVTQLHIPNGTNQFATGSIFYTRVMNYGGFDHYGNLGCNPVWYKGTSIDCRKCSQNTYPCGICQEINASSFVGLDGVSSITIPDKSVITVKKANGTPIQGAKVYVLNDDGNYYNREIRTTDSTGKVSYNIYERTPVSFYAVPYKGFNFRGNNHISYYSPVPETIQVPNVDSTVTVTRLGSPVRNARVEITNAQNSRINNTTIYTDSNGKASFAVPDGTSFKFYVEINGAPYISSSTRVAPFDEQFIPIVSGTPILNQPLNNGVYNIDQDYNWTWEDVAGATYYYVQFRLGTGNWVGGLVDDPFATLNFGSLGSWEFFVQAIDNSYNVIAVSETRTFTTVTSGGAAYSAPLGSQTRSATRVNSETDLPLFQLRNEISQNQDKLTFQSVIFEENDPETEYEPTEPLDDTNQDTNGIVIKGQKDLTPKLEHSEDYYWDSLIIDPEMYFMNEILGLGDSLLNESECCPNH